MIRQAFKLIWNQRGKHLGLFVEILFSFLVLFLVFSFSIYNLEEFFKPLGFNYENVWTISFNREGTEEEPALQIDRQIEQALSAYTEIEDFAWSSGNVPFANTSTSSAFETEFGWVDCNRFTVGDNFAKTMQVEVIEGRWFEEQDQLKDLPAFVLSENAAKALFPDQSAVGKKIQWLDSDRYHEVVGVVSNYRYRGGIVENGEGLFIRKNQDELISSILLRVDPEATAAFEARLMKSLQQIAPGYSIEIRYIDQMRENYLMISFIPLLILSIIGIFLIFNVALGLFGVLWQNINQRRQEIGIRRAMGSSKAEVTIQFIIEVMVLASISLILGIFFAIQFPLLDVFGVSAGIYILAIVFAAISIYLLVFVCALVPSAQAAELHPAVALREE